MIIYLASYPRSGNSLLQQIVARSFRILTSQIVKGSIISPNWVAEWGLKPSPTAPAGWDPSLLWSDITAIYKTTRRFVLPLALERLDEETRQHLAAERERFFIKTHHPPYPRYFEGERVVHLVRHPGPTLWSYFCYLSDRPRPRPVSLEQIIRGISPWGSWGSYQLEWTKAEARLGAQYRRIRYEDVLADPHAATVLLSHFAEVKVVSTRLEIKEKSKPYLTKMSSRQLTELWSAHGAVAAELGYEIGDLSKAVIDDQIVRLARAIELLTKSSADKEISLSEYRLRLRRLSDTNSAR